MKAVYCIEWTEYERGWGCRPAGFTLHATAEDAKQYIDDYWARMPNSAPDEYDEPGKPFLVEVSDELHEKVNQMKSMWGNGRTWAGRTE